MMEFDPRAVMVLIRKERWVTNIIHAYWYSALYTMASGGSRQWLALFAVTFCVWPLSFYRSGIRGQIPDMAYTWQLEHRSYWPIAAHMTIHLSIVIVFAANLLQAPWVTPGRFLVGLWGGFYLGAITLWPRKAWWQGFRKDALRARWLRLYNMVTTLAIGISFAVCGSTWGTVLGAAIISTLYLCIPLRVIPPDTTVLIPIRAWRMSSNWSETKFRTELLSVIPRTWHNFTATHSDEKIAGFAVFSAVNHGYITLSGFTEEGLTASGAENPWWPPNSPHFNLLTLSGDGVSRTEESSSKSWRSWMRKHDVSDLRLAADSHPQFSSHFLDMMVEVLLELKTTRAFGADPAIVLLVVDAGASTVNDDIARRLNQGPAWERYCQIGRAERPTEG